eukprot:GHVU01118320.1.p1 GENE.GHVU01118320.1~~GHVU01118320.1.p1  ORF type:complete len:786 (-),score=118.71 GHVU01118320.1:115-2166(-)
MPNVGIRGLGWPSMPGPHGRGLSSLGDIPGCSWKRCKRRRAEMEGEDEESSRKRSRLEPLAEASRRLMLSLKGVALQLFRAVGASLGSSLDGCPRRLRLHMDIGSHLPSRISRVDKLLRGSCSRRLRARTCPPRFRRDRASTDPGWRDADMLPCTSSIDVGGAIEFVSDESLGPAARMLQSDSPHRHEEGEEGEKGVEKEKENKNEKDNKNEKKKEKETGDRTHGNSDKDAPEVNPEDERPRDNETKEKERTEKDSSTAADAEQSQSQFDGWVTHRRQKNGNEWCLIRLACPTRVRALKVEFHPQLSARPSIISVEAAALEKPLKASSADADSPTDPLCASTATSSPEVEPLIPEDSIDITGNASPTKKTAKNSTAAAAAAAVAGVRVLGGDGRVAGPEAELEAQMLQHTEADFSQWTDLLPGTLGCRDERNGGPSCRVFPVAFRADRPVTHVRVNLFPDGGVSRLSVLGLGATRHWNEDIRHERLLELAGIPLGACVLGASTGLLPSNRLLWPSGAGWVATDSDDNKGSAAEHSCVVKLAHRCRIVAAVIRLTGPAESRRPSTVAIESLDDPHMMALDVLEQQCALHPLNDEPSKAAAWNELASPTPVPEDRGSMWFETVESASGLKEQLGHAAACLRTPSDASYGPTATHIRIRISAVRDGPRQTISIGGLRVLGVPISPL